MIGAVIAIIIFILGFLSGIFAWWISGVPWWPDGDDEEET